MSDSTMEFSKNIISNWPFSDRASAIKANAIREILKISSRPGIINFAGGLPAAELFPETHLKAASEVVFRKHGPKALQYSLTQGIYELREILAERSSTSEMKFNSDTIQITTGSQQALDLIGRAFLNPGDYVLTEAPTYLGALSAFNFYQARYCTVPMDEHGMIVEMAEEKIKECKPKLIYVVPNFQNPSGITMSAKRREALVEIAARYQIPIIDDNPYGELRYSGDSAPSLKSLGGNAVVSLGTFSKIISPGIRVGWVAACREVTAMLEKVKQSTDLHSTTFCQYLVYEYIMAGHLDSHIELIKEAYSKRRDVMINTMANEFPQEVKFTRPEGGLFLWITLPEGISATEVFDKAVDAGVACVPGLPFYPHGDNDQSFRVNFCHASEDNIVEGIRRLASVLHKELS
ncbi:MAG: PLP-dependent aminotransferase family protein [candidate division Zixibacteria bacterium]|nr:PLP-dependent aminotransferase family protein [candidate division Zixibacteria bacterium]NIR68022.1 PLP-dependent aminotransferase family protein [candidate division Zixibacteria bacterium]NIS17531.1 PLP-dependent aminotransferase family protein [candidate division Zixibacteria bacterium]NIS49233.1 PLP-dependent aminotransferase family protein [candidate division Zixibacteria bacterium]NIT53838.1 PLP-dependent aminotransferase family protein [candidate division Zixibacteria bacterium]